MSWTTIVADLAGAGGMFFFLVAEILQLRKIIRKKTVKSISYNTYRNKVVAIMLSLVCFGLTSLWLSWIVIFAELLIIIWVIKLMHKYRGR